MILPDYLNEEVKKFCKLNNISMINGEIPPQYLSQIQAFVSQRMQKDRRITRRVEQDKGMHIGNILTKVMGEGPELSIEDYMKDALERADLYKYCKPQHSVGTKFVDFGFPEAKLAVECDGKEYHFTEASQIERDQKRDKYLAQRGWRVLHIEGSAIRRNIGLCIEKIKKALGNTYEKGAAK